MTEADFPEHACSLHLEHNPHRNVYESVPDWISDNAYREHFQWTSTEQKDKAVATDNLWTLQWYPNTPIGFYSLVACDLDVLLTAARAVKANQ